LSPWLSASLVCGVTSPLGFFGAGSSPTATIKALSQALVRFLWTLEPNASGVNLPYLAYAPQPNETFNADANIGHRFAILMANVGALRASRSGAG
jgi:hypothetical protein